MSISSFRFIWGVFLIAATLCFWPTCTSPVAAQEPTEEEPAEEAEEEEGGELGPLNFGPLTPDLSDFVFDKKAAIVLGKSLFWDMQVSSDGRTACATCHFHAGVDNRTRNTLAPNGAGIDNGGGLVGEFRAANVDISADDFPFHLLEDRTDRDSDVLYDTSEIVGSQGVTKREFKRIREGRAREPSRFVEEPVFNVGGCNARQVTGRSTPNVINAVFNDRQFWDGRANRFFNGVNIFGDTDPNAKVWRCDNGRKPEQVRILIDNASLASQAVAPLLSDVEMSWMGRSFPDIARKLFSLRPLRKQRVHAYDSVLGKIANKKGRGLKKGVSYPKMIREAFHPEWWAGKYVDGKNTQMEANFSLFWGIAIMCYESTLISDQSKFDLSFSGSAELTDQEKLGMDIFNNEGKCVNCHKGPETTGASARLVRDNPIEFMTMQIGPEAFYDNGFYNIGVRPTAEDLGVGSEGSFGPFSFTRRRQNGDKVGQDIHVRPDARVAVDGAFKTPTLRNIELTGPYMHNGGMRTLREVVEFYIRGADFFNKNIDNLDPDVDGIKELGKNQGQFDEEKVEALVAFLKTLTDERVRLRKAPFDHPELIITNGHGNRARRGVLLDSRVRIPAVGADGGDAVLPFEEVVN